MAKFVNGVGIVLTQEEKNRISNSQAPIAPNLIQAAKDYFIGWEIKEPKRKIPVQDDNFKPLQAAENEPDEVKRLLADSGFGEFYERVNAKFYLPHDEAIDMWNEYWLNII